MMDYHGFFMGVSPRIMEVTSGGSGHLINADLTHRDRARIKVSSEEKVLRDIPRPWFKLILMWFSFLCVFYPFSLHSF